MLPKNLFDYINWNNILIEAAGNGDINVVKFVIGKGANNFYKALICATKKRTR